MSVTVTPTRDGPDFSGQVRIEISEAPAGAVVFQSGSSCSFGQQGDSCGDVSARLYLQDARELFGKLGKALEVIDANADPEAT